MTETTARDDIEAIRQLKARYFRGLDSQDWDGLSEVFTADALIDTTDDAGPGGKTTGGDRFAANLKKLLAGAVTEHRGRDLSIEITGADTARGVWALEDRVRFPPEFGVGEYRGTARYEEEYKRIDGRWRIARMVLRREYAEIDGKVVFPR